MPETTNPLETQSLFLNALNKPSETSFFPLHIGQTIQNNSIKYTQELENLFSMPKLPTLLLTLLIKREPLDITQET